MNHQQYPYHPITPWLRMVGWASCMLVVVMLLFVAPARITHAQSAEWQERTTTHFVILYTPGDEAKVEEYASFVDVIYEDVATVFSHRVETPITLRLYPSRESYQQVNPLAPNLPDIVAHADFRHREVAVILPMTDKQTPQDVQNNVRHELTHIVAADLSENRLNTGFQEGLAQYVEEYGPTVEGKLATLRQNYDEGRLLAWSDFEDREKVYGDPRLSYPQTLSVVAFLIDQYGFATFRDFLTISARSSGYRSALERTYGVSPTDLEAAWLVWLPTYMEGGFRQNALTSYDLSHARQLFDLGRYEEAQTELEQAIVWLSSEERQELLGEQGDTARLEAETLLRQSTEGMRAEELAQEARAALKNADYERAGQLAAEAQALYRAIGDTRQDVILNAYSEWANRGIAAKARLEQAMSHSQALNFPQARQEAEAAAEEFALLGDSERMEQAVQFRRSLDSRQHMAGLTLVALGIMGIVFSLWSRWLIREEEVW